MAASSSSSSTSTSRRSTKHPYTSHHYPSSALLSLFTTVFASSFTTVQAIPAPPPFLCPSLDQSSYNDGPCLSVRSNPSKEPVPLTPRRSQSARRSKSRRKVPPKYVEGDDGRWRKATHYSLYGSTIAAAECQYPTGSGLPSVDDAINNSDSGSSSSAAGDTAMPTSTTSFLDTLPSGWKPLLHEDRTALILTISLVLAFFICVVIISSILWRRSLRRMRDVEQRVKKKRKSQKEEDMEILVEKELKSKKKLWARATARWKANARYSARQRKGRRRTVLTSDVASIHSQNSPEFEGDRSTAHETPRSLSRRSSTSSLASNTPSSVVSSPLGDPTTENQPVASSSPPAYLSSTTSPDSTVTQGVPKSCESDTPSSGNSISNHFPPPSDEQVTRQPAYTPSAHAGHIATDDKTILERMALFASVPPEEDGSSRLSDQHVQVSAPLWYDEQLEDFADPETPGPPSSPTAPDHPPYHSLFPSPPASASEKGKMREYYDYEYSFGSSSLDHDILTVEPESGPSAPPFEAAELHSKLFPSAPPIGEEDELEYVDELRLTPSAPPAEYSENDGFPSLTESQHTSSNAQGLGDTSSSSNVVIQGPIARDGTLPEYHS
ncbi:hypothetical protein K435DRAFT_836827 [Dendrothele bispora CBS 962.96]|uniref:Uncharacterized protein n=1 Tax=Dendrothele bispora (strain CBS 962.96) TaxID=1314807 RepID=A0A4S8MGT1_DENBC|nr:hypothetical protein K435DRAFT_836827 [Dendrothele bispora CBS 962.96]